MQIIDGRKIRDEILKELQARVARLQFEPIFCDILVGDDPASVQYVSMKERVAESIGIKTYHANFPSHISTEELTTEIKKISQMDNMTGLIVQLPLPEHIDTKKVLDSVPLKIDVDSISSEAIEKFYSSKTIFVPPTALAVLAVLDSISLSLSELNVVIFGYGMLVGRPVEHVLKSRGVSASIVDKNTNNAEGILSKANVIVSAVGKAGILNGKNLKEGVVIIDAGTSESNGSIAGDVDYESVKNIASIISPVPGGVGPVTVAMLMKNVVLGAENFLNK